MSHFKVVMIRHGESKWNQKNLFCGWYDSKLTEKGNTRVPMNFVINY